MPIITNVIGPAFDDVLAAAQHGADWAVSVLYREFNPGLVRFLTAQARASGEDLAQEVWLAAAPRLCGFEGNEAGFRAWLFTIARRRLIQHWRDTGRRPAVATAPEDLVAVPSNTDDIAAADAAAAAAELVAGLPADQAEVVLLRVVGGFDADEVGRIIGKRAGAVRVIQHRALRKLAEKISGDRVTP